MKLALKRFVADAILACPEWVWYLVPEVVKWWAFTYEE